MKVVNNHTKCESSLNVRNPSPVSEDVSDSALLNPPFRDSCEKARGKVCNALPWSHRSVQKRVSTALIAHGGKSKAIVAK
jgi:hypothetical protein